MIPSSGMKRKRKKKPAEAGAELIQTRSASKPEIFCGSATALL
jgi:hypothetical protein